MERNELLRRLVLNEISHDYENIDQIIFPHVEKLGFTIQRSDIVNALAELIEQRSARAYLLFSREP